LRIESGEVFGLLGPNRAGKTTLVKMLLSLCRPTAGEVFRLGRPLSDRSTLGQVGYVHENHAFPRYLSAADLLEYYGALTLMPSDLVRERVPRLLERVGLADRSREPIARFSKGMLQRLGIAQALLNAPRLLVLDEPTEGLDLNGRRLCVSWSARCVRAAAACCSSRTSCRKSSTCATASACWSTASSSTSGRWPS
jgi:ABC-2 type transport system ATP-binding protein